MLPGPFRLKRSSLYPKTMASGKTLCSSPYFVMLALPRAYESATPTRFGVVVSKKVSNKATARNRARRRLRELIRTEIVPQRLEKVKPYVSVIVIARKPILEASYSDLKTAFLQCVKDR